MTTEQPTVDARPHRVLQSIQHLRGVAASMVVLHHSAEDYSTSLMARLDFGQSGVATFFAISGFIIWTSSRKESVSQFVERRFLRVVPMYWLALAAVLLIGIHSWHKPIFSPAAIVQSLLFIPYFTGPVTETPFPVLIPGWTLNFEMLFYSVFAIGMAVHRPLLVPAAVMTGFFIVGQLFVFTAAPLVLYTKWLSILFVAGLFIGQRAPSRPVAAALWPLGVPLILVYNLLPRPEIALACGIILLIVGVTAWERLRGWPRIAALGALGDASYAIYLFHMPTVFLIHFALFKLGLRTLPWLAYGALCLAGSWAVGLLIHRYVEKPLNGRLRRGPRPAHAV